MKKLIQIGMLLPAIAFASNEQGTGTPESDGGHHLIGDGMVTIALTLDGQHLLGAVDPDEILSVIEIKQVDHDSGLLTDWGVAEVQLGCHEADLLLYQLNDGGSETVSTVRIPTLFCPQN